MGCFRKLDMDGLNPFNIIGSKFLWQKKEVRNYETGN